MSVTSIGSAHSEQVQEIVGVAWQRVIQVINRILDVHSEFGFESFKARMNPSLEEIINNLTFVEFALTEFLDRGVLDHDRTKEALNSKQCVLTLRRIAAALEEGDEDGYQAAIREFQLQPQL